MVVVTYAQIAEAARNLTACGPVRAAILRVHPATAYELEREVWSDVFTPYTPPGLGGPGPLGLTVVVDDGLPRGAWRLCDADDTLLYDSREGTSALDG